MNVSRNHSIVAIYPAHTAAEAAVTERHQAGFDMKNPLRVGRADHTEAHRVGHDNAEDRWKQAALSRHPSW